MLAKVQFASLFFRLRLLVGTVHGGDRSPLGGTAAAGSELIHPAPCSCTSPLLLLL